MIFNNLLSVVFFFIFYTLTMSFPGAKSFLFILTKIGAFSLIWGFLSYINSENELVIIFLNILIIFALSFLIISFLTLNSCFTCSSIFSVLHCNKIPYWYSSSLILSSTMSQLQSNLFCFQYQIIEIFISKYSLLVKKMFFSIRSFFFFYNVSIKKNPLTL